MLYFYMVHYGGLVIFSLTNWLFYCAHSIFKLVLFFLIYFANQTLLFPISLIISVLFDGRNISLHVFKDKIDYFSLFKMYFFKKGFKCF